MSRPLTREKIMQMQMQMQPIQDIHGRPRFDPTPWQGPKNCLVLLANVG